MIQLYPQAWLFLDRSLLGKFFHKGATEDKFAVATLRVSRNENFIIGAPRRCPMNLLKVSPFPKAITIVAPNAEKLWSARFAYEDSLS